MTKLILSIEDYDKSCSDGMRLTMQLDSVRYDVNQ